MLDEFGLTTKENQFMDYLDAKFDKEVKAKKKTLSIGDRVKAKHTPLYGYSEKAGVVIDKDREGVWVRFDDGDVALCDPYYIDREGGEE